MGSRHTWSSSRVWDWVASARQYATSITVALTHPENAGTPYVVRLGRLGAQLYHHRYCRAIPDGTAQFERLFSTVSTTLAQRVQLWALHAPTTHTRTRTLPGKLTGWLSLCTQLVAHMVCQTLPCRQR